MNENMFWRRLRNRVWIENFTYEEAIIMYDALSFHSEMLIDGENKRILQGLLSELGSLINR